MEQVGFNGGIDVTNKELLRSPQTNSLLIHFLPQVKPSPRCNKIGVENIITSPLHNGNGYLYVRKYPLSKINNK